MPRAITRVIIGALATAALVGAVAVPAQAASAPGPVAGAHEHAQNWEDRSVQLIWNGVSGATYQVKYSLSPSFSSGVTYRSTSATSAWIGPFTPGQTYYAVVRAIVGGRVGAYSACTAIKVTPGYTGLFSSVAAKPAANGITLSWGAAPYATDYRVVSSAGPNPNRRPDYWVPSASSWFSAFAPVTKSRTIAGTAANLTSTAYGNPIYAHVEAKSTIKPSTNIRSSAQVVAWPAPVKPDASAPAVRFGSYNVECAGCEKPGTPGWSTRGPAIAANITQQNLDVLTVLEASGDTDAATRGVQQAYTDLDRRLTDLTLTDSGTVDGTPDQGNRIFYNPSKYDLVDRGTLGGMPDYRQTDAWANPLYTPWAELRIKGTGSTFIVVAAHYGVPTTSDQVVRKTQLGTDSAQLLKALTAMNTSHLPVIMGADFNDNRYPEGRTDGAQPTLIRGGFYDASASMARYGTAKSTYNDNLTPAKQASDPNGNGQRIDYILTQGFQGSDQFTNDYLPRGTNGQPLSVVPSDHNLIDTTLHVPASSTR